jgi:heat shock protein HtpX
MARVPCPRCGTLNPEGAAYCTLCQTIFRSPRSVAAATPAAAPVPAPAQGPAATAAPAARPDRRRSFWDEQVANRRRSWVLMTLFVLLLAALGGAIGGAYGAARAGLLLCLALGVLSAAAAFFGGDRVILAASGAREVAPADAPQLHNIVEELCVASGLPKPRLFVIESEAPNAFATGRSQGSAAVAVTSGLLRKLDRAELQGVLAHEMSHIRNLDVRYAMLVGILAGMVALVCDAHLRGLRFSGVRRARGASRGGGLMVIVALLLAILAPLASRLIQLAISRRRELLADASAVELTRNPLGLAAALRRIGTDPAPLEAANRATQHLYIANPVKAAGPTSSALWSTHPPIEARIRILESMA